jgi:hypothetical protein
MRLELHRVVDPSGETFKGTSQILIIVEVRLSEPTRVDEAGTLQRSQPLLRNILWYITYSNYSRGSFELAHKGDPLIRESLWPPAYISNSSPSWERFKPDEPIL